MNDTYKNYLGKCIDDLGRLAPRFLYVAPVLSEVDRISQACPQLNFRVPQPVKGRKLNHLASLVNQGANICTTHALFALLTRDIYESLKDQNYILVIDEALDSVHMFEGLSASDRNLLLKDGHLYVEPETNRLRWNNRDHGRYAGKFDAIKNLCDNGNLINFDGVLIWEFPADFLQCFKQVFVLTYMFEGSPMAAHLKGAGLRYDLNTLEDGDLVSWWDHCDEAEVKAKLRNLISVYEGSANNWGASRGRSNPFSVGWLKRSEGDLRAIRAVLENWFKKGAETPTSANAWTTFKSAKRRLSGARYARGFIPCNAKGTNDYIEKRSLAYLCNIFYNPMIKRYFHDRGIEVQEELHALSEMIQWIWRSQIRRGDPITILIPSERMRSLFKRWLAASHVAELIDQDSRLAA
ncbi:hypothetical protein [Microvirga alba]|uniref:Uncharacterized protein n=1 Tax=Microvirga alba TaxID=2791025 RepID=A0A931BRI8_9HYPH|nr:hypothetical protein [Microvirga alba]MBF9233328.1 hypothetical protein [Microvirga alba]